MAASFIDFRSSVGALSRVAVCCSVSLFRVIATAMASWTSLCVGLFCKKTSISLISIKSTPFWSSILYLCGWNSIFYAV